jgi:hypothetical protein
MPNKVIHLGNNLGVLAVDNGDGATFALSTKLLTAASAALSADVAASLFGVNIPIRLVSNTESASGLTYSLAVATPVTPAPSADLAVSLFGPNVPMRLIALSGSAFALAVKTLTAPYSALSADQAWSIFGVNLPIRLVANGGSSAVKTFSLAIATPVTPMPSADSSAMLFGSNVPIRLVALGDGTYAVGAVAHA